MENQNRQIPGKAGARLLALLLALALAASLAPPVGTAAAGTEYTDVAPEAWYYEAINTWSSRENGILFGYGDGSFGPDDAMRAADLDIVVARLLGGDVPEWANSETVTREAAAKTLAIALGLEAVNEPTELYEDDEDIDAAYRPYVYALKDSGYQHGVGDGKFAPKSTFTRAQIIQTAHNAVSAIADSDVTDKTYERGLIVRSADVTVKDTTVKGDLIIGHGVGDGDVTLDGTTVEGRLIVYGGGSHSIVVKGGSKVAAVVAGKPNVHIQLESGAVIQSIEIVENGVRITVEKGASVEILTVDADGASVEGGGTLAQVTVKPEAVGAIVTTPNTIIINDSRDYVTTATGVVKAGDTQTTPDSSDGNTSNPGGTGTYVPTYPNTPTPTPTPTLSPTPPPTPTPTPTPPPTPTLTPPPTPTPTPIEPSTVEVDTAEGLVQIIKAGTENVRIVVTENMTLTTDVVGEYEPFDAYDLLMGNRPNSTLYIPAGVTVTMESGITFRIGGGTTLEIDGTLNLAGAGMWVGGRLTVNGALTSTTGNNGLMFDSKATVNGNGESVSAIGAFPAKSYVYNIGFAFNEGKWEDDGIFWANADTEEQLLDIVSDEISGFNIYGSFDITEPIAPKIWVIEDGVTLTIKSTFTVQGTLNIAGAIAGAAGGTVIIPANAQIKSVLWGGGWLSEENGTGGLHGLPVDKLEYERIYVWQDGAWVLQQQQQQQ
ncbi:MAG: S-layer homology domain-containing protein [Oscillospiraceae bacterium]|jgi:hypothetical protein|nr:S-layer homology domain-containing protein [Oscillospiraceae bacterium]